MRTWWVVPVLAVGACQRPPPPAPPPAPARPTVVVPDGCLADLSGDWVHVMDPSFRYRATDDGGTVDFVVTRVELPDARFHPRKFRDAGVASPVGRADAGAPLRRDAGVPTDAGGADAGPATPADDDAGVPAPSLHLVLSRTAQGFVGETRLTVQHPSGRDCEAVFHAEVVDCRDGGVVIEATPSISLGDACQAPESGAAAPPVRHALRRPALP